MTILIKNAVVVTFVGTEPEPKIYRSDILIEDGKIAKLEAGIKTPSSSSCEIVDGSQYLVCPGFIDGHRHVWQTILRGHLGDMTLPEYMVKQTWTIAPHITAQEAYHSQSAGLCECAHVGVTTVLDHMHLANSPEHIEATLKASVESKVRTIFCSGPTSYPTDLSSMQFGNSQSDFQWQTEKLYELLDRQAKGEFSDITRIGLGYDRIGAGPKEIQRDFIQTCREKGLKHITSHFVSGPGLPFGSVSSAEHWHNCDSLSQDIVFSHTTYPTERDYKLIKEAGASICATPEDELAMAHGNPVAFEASQVYGIRTSLGVDSTAIVGGDAFTAMRVALADARGRRNVQVEAQASKGSKTVIHPLRENAKDVFRMMTLGGAEALRLEDQIGSIEEGKYADLVMIRANSPSMVGFGEALRAIVFNANVGDIEHVIIRGDWAKRDGKLVDVDWNRVSSEVESAAKALRSRLPTEEATEKKWLQVAPKIGWTLA